MAEVTSCFAKTHAAGGGVLVPAVLRTSCGWVHPSQSAASALGDTHQSMGRYVGSFTTSENAQPRMETLGV